jgi:hypothetical protein
VTSPGCLLLSVECCINQQTQSYRYNMLVYYSPLLHVSVVYIRHHIVSLMISDVYWLIKHFTDFRNVLQELYSPAELQVFSRDTFCLGLDFRTAWRSVALQQDELSVPANYRRLRKGTQLTCTTYMLSGNTPYGGIRKINN